MTLKKWLKEQEGQIESVGEIRLQQLWDAAQNSEREECAYEIKKLQSESCGVILNNNQKIADLEEENRIMRSIISIYREDFNAIKTITDSHK